MLRSFCVGADSRGTRSPAQPVSVRTTSIPGVVLTGAIRQSDSLHRGNHEFRAFLRTGRPARSNGFRFGVEADRVGAMLVEISKAGTLPAAKGVIGERDRNRKINADHPDLHLVDKIARRIAVTGEDGNAVAVFVL